MKNQKLKNILILVLVLAAGYQTGRLWLDDTASHAFFYSVLAYFDQGNEQMAPVSRIIAPSHMMLGYGNKRFAVLTDGAESQGVEERANQVLADVIQEGTYLSTGPVDWALYLENRVMVMRYAVTGGISTTEFVKGFSGKGSRLTSQVKTFDTIAVVPARTDADETMVYFINGETQEAAAFSLNGGSNAGTALYTAIDRFIPQNRLYYISTKQNGINLFPEDAFMPQWQTGTWSYPLLVRVNPFVAAAGGTVTEPVEGFFNNYNATSQELDGETGGYVVSDTTTVVKYYPTGVLEYYNYEAEKKTQQTLASAYTACMEFLETKDTALEIDYYLADVAYKDGLTFYFDYAINGFPLHLSDDLKEDLGLTHALEVVVQNDTVRKYKKLAYYFDLSTEELGTVEQDFLSVLDGVIAAYSGEEAITKVDQIALNYQVGRGQKSELRWFVTLNGEVYMQDTKKE